MKKRVRGLICLWLVIIMALGALPLTASAAGTGYVFLIRDVDPTNGYYYSFFNDNGSSSFGIELDVALDTQQALQDELVKEMTEGYVFDGWKLWVGVGSGGVIDSSYPPIEIDANGVVTETAYMDIESRGDQALLEALWVQKYKMDPQPTSLAPTVGVMQADGAGWTDVTTRSDISYQWYPYGEKSYRVVDSAVGADEMEVDTIYGDTRYSDTLGAWENPVAAEIDIAFGVQAGDRIIVTASNASTTAVVSTYGETDDYARDGAVFSQTMTADITQYNIYIRGYTQGESFVISVLRGDLGTALAGETSHTLATRATGTYVCRATVGNETTLTSAPVSITAPVGNTVVWKNEDGTVLETDTAVAVGTVPTYDGATPTKAPTAEYSYTFAGWTPAIGAVTGDATYSATYTQTKNKYTVTFENEDGSVLQSGEVEYGTEPKYLGATPYKPSDSVTYAYVFKEWSPAIGTVTGDVTYKATYTQVKVNYLVTFADEDGTVLQSDYLDYGAMPLYRGETPTKAADDGYVYTFVGWTPAVVAVSEPQTYLATYEKTPNSFTVTFVDADGTKLQSEQLAYGAMPAYKGATPTKAADAEYTYTFAGWDAAIEAVTGDKIYKATYDKAKRQYTVIFVNEDGTELGRETLAYGATPEYRGETPVKSADAQNTYTFAGWTPALDKVTGDKTYKATYTQTVNTYTVVFEDEDGEELWRGEFAYGVMPEYRGETPTKADDADNSYTFADWTPALAAVTEDATYKATYTTEPLVANSYLVSFESNGGSEVESVQVSAGDKLTAPVAPEKDGHSFKGWYRDEALTEEYDFESAVNESFTLYAKWQSSFNVWLLLAILALVLLVLLLVWLLLRRRNRKDESSNEKA